MEDWLGVMQKKKKGYYKFIHMVDKEELSTINS